MNRTPKLLVAFVAVFIAGIAVGVAAGIWHARHVIFHMHGRDMPARMRQHLAHELNLSADQSAKVDPILQHLIGELEQIRRETNTRVADAMKRSHDEIAPFLNPDQQARLNALEQRHRDAFRHHGVPPPPP